VRGFLLVAMALLIAGARENPFVLPSQSHSQPKSSSYSSVAIFTPLVRETLPSLAPSSKGKGEERRREGREKREERERLVKDLGFVAFYTREDGIAIRTSDPVKRVFTIDNPKKIVFDFAKGRDFPTKVIRLSHPNFKNIAIGAHKRFYRVAIEIDPRCRPKIEKESKEIICR